MIETKIGLDATELKNLEILAVDRKKLFKQSYKGIRNRVKIISQREIELHTGEKMPSVKIIDNLFFGDFSCGETYVPETRQYHRYVCISINAGHILSDNRNNILVKEYKNYIENILTWYLEERYGITVDFSTAQMQVMEVNVNIPLNKSFEEYTRILKLFLKIIPGQGKIGKIASNRRQKETTYNQWNNSEKLTLYDKKHDIDSEYNTPRKRERAYMLWHMKKEILEECPNKEKGYFGNELEYECEECLRIELGLYNKGRDKSRTSSRKKIEKFLNISDSLLQNITDENLKEKYLAYLQEKILLPFTCWYVENKKEVRKLAVEYKLKYGQSWQSYFYPALYKIEIHAGMIFIIDFVHLRDCLNFNKMKQGINFKHNLTYTINGFINKEKKNEEWDAFSKNDSQKIIEIFQKLGFTYEPIFRENEVNLFPSLGRKRKKGGNI